MRNYIINTQKGFVAGFNAQHQIVSFSARKEGAKTFRSQHAAIRWAEKYASAGYGLSAFEVVEVSQ